MRDVRRRRGEGVLEGHAPCAEGLEPRFVIPRLSGGLVGLALVLASAWLGARLRGVAEAHDPRLRTVARVIDGDTLVLEGGAVVRVLGVDTPETVNPSLAGPQPVGAEASARTAALVLGRRVRLEADAEDTDHYGRLLRHVWVGDTLLAEVLVREGLGREGLQPQNRLYRGRLRAAETEARAERRGIWGTRVATPLAVFGDS